MKLNYSKYLWRGLTFKYCIAIMPYDEFIALIPGPLIYSSDDNKTEKLMKFAEDVLDDIMSGKIAIPNHSLNNLTISCNISTPHHTLYDIVDGTGKTIACMDSCVVHIFHEKNIIGLGGYNIVFNDSTSRWDVFNSGTFICSVDDSEDIDYILNHVIKEV